jgi:hypothetical protein
MENLKKKHHTRVAQKFEPGSCNGVMFTFTAPSWCVAGDEGGLSGGMPNFPSNTRVDKLAEGAGEWTVTCFINYVILAIRYPLSATDTADQPKIGQHQYPGRHSSESRLHLL